MLKLCQNQAEIKPPGGHILQATSKVCDERARDKSRSEDGVKHKDRNQAAGDS